MPTNPYTKALVAAAFIGIGVALFASAISDVRNRPCEDCDDDALETIDDVATASADMSVEAAGDDV